MHLTTLFLILLAALFHSIWNILAKNSRNNLTLLWLQMVITAVILLPYSLLIFDFPVIDAWPTLLFTSAMQITYYILLSRCYRSGNLSIVYPLTRGSAPVFVCLFSMLLGTENLSLPIILSLLLTVFGIYLVNMPELTLASLTAPFKVLKKDKTTRLSILIGIIVAAYTISDKRNVLYCDPLLVYTVICVIPALCLAPFMLRKRALKEELTHGGWFRALAVAAFTFLAYYLVLAAMRSCDASYVSSIREVSVVFVAIYTCLKNKETQWKSKITGSVIIFIGIFLLAYL
jgi:drug/metabolite transporter (DMT)-like permease